MEIISKFYEKKLLFEVSMHLMHHFQDKISYLDFLTSVLRALVSISQKNIINSTPFGPIYK